MKTSILLLSFFLCFTTYSQESSGTDSTVSAVFKNYLTAINGDKMDSISSIQTRYKGQTPMGEIIIEKTTSEDDIIEKWILSGNVLMHVVATKEECYQVSNGEKKPLPATMCKEFKRFIATIPEINLSKENITELEEVEAFGEKCYSITMKGESTSYSYIYSQSTGLKLQEIQVTKSGNNVAESSTRYKDYESYENVKFPTVQINSNFMQTGVDVEFKLEEVKFNVTESND